jgi:DNA-binding GntR family transcriptional regulator
MENHRFSVTSPSAPEWRGLREALETYAADLVILEGRHRELADELEALSQEMAAFTEGDIYTDYDAFIERDRAFHMALVRRADNSRMTESYQRLNVHLHIMRAHYVRVFEERPMSIPTMQRFSPPFAPATPEPQEPRLPRI